MPEPRSLEEWVIHCAKSGHNECFCHHTLCRNCARSYVEQETAPLLMHQYEADRIEERVRSERDALLAVARASIMSKAVGISQCKICGHTWLSSNDPWHYKECPVAHPAVRRLVVTANADLTTRARVRVGWKEVPDA